MSSTPNLEDWATRGRRHRGASSTSYVSPPTALRRRLPCARDGELRFGSWRGAERSISYVRPSRSATAVTVVEVTAVIVPGTYAEWGSLT